ncbi:MAG: glycosyltransferase [bacterium]|nr:glycosyltransferase [bacterium]
MASKDLKMKIALVYDRVNKIGGAERILTALHEIWPEAPLYTAVYNKETASWADDFDVKTSFLQNFPFAKTHHEFFMPIAPLAFESFNFNDYDVVISITSAEAKGIITGPKTLHVCYCLTPTRYLWSSTWEYPIPFFLRPIMTKIRCWDYVAAQRPDVYLAISNCVAGRIKKYYRREAKVIYPPVDLEKWEVGREKWEVGDYFLVVSRLVPYKRIDIAIEAFNELKLPLKIIGIGTEEKKLKRMAKGNIEFLGQLTDKEVLSYYQKCKAVVFPQDEDFGLVPLEAQTCGKPVIAYKGGGALETIVEGSTGEFFYPQESGALKEKIRQFDALKYKKEFCIREAGKFDKIAFLKKFKEFVEEEWKNYLKNISMS